MTTYDWTDIYPTLNLSLIFVNFSLHHLQVFIKRIIIKLTNQKETELIMINIPEILVANGTGAFLVLFLLLYRIRIAQTNQFDEISSTYTVAVTSNFPLLLSIHFTNHNNVLIYGIGFHWVQNYAMSLIQSGHSKKSLTDFNHKKIQRRVKTYRDC